MCKGWLEGYKRQEENLEKNSVMGAKVNALLRMAYSL